MDKNTIIAAPASADIGALYQKWQATHPGRLSDFYAFLTSPTMERDAFLAECEKRTVRTHAALVLYS